MTIELIQFLMPNGRQKAVQTDIDDSCQPAYADMIRHGARLECECLTTGEVSVTVSLNGEDKDISITPNGPEVQKGIAKMLTRKAWLDDVPFSAS